MFENMVKRKQNENCAKKKGHAARMPVIQESKYSNPRIQEHNKKGGYSSIDKKLINQYQLCYIREDYKQNRYFEARYIEQKQRCGFKKVTDQVMFYRAMKMKEAKSWLSGDGRINDSGQPWASYSDYSLSYITNNSKERVLLEVYAPEFLNWANEIGFYHGKGESRGEGDFSWGIGPANENSWRLEGGKDNFRKAFSAAHEEYEGIRGDKKKENTVSHAEKVGLDKTEAPVFNKQNAAKVLPYLFKKAIRYKNVVYLKSCKPD